MLCARICARHRRHYEGAIGRGLAAPVLAADSRDSPGGHNLDVTPGGAGHGTRDPHSAR